MNRRLFAATLAATACRRSRSSGKRRIRLAALPRLHMAGFYLADELGYFADEGLEIEVIKPPLAAGIYVLLSGGEADATITSISAGLINAIGQGSRARIAAGRLRLTPGCGDAGRLFGSRQAFPEGFQSLQLLRGKRIAVNSAGGPQNFYLDVFLRTAGLTRADLDVQTLGVYEAAVLLGSGRLDAMVSLGEDIALSSTRGQYVEGPVVSDLLPGFMYSYLTFGRSLLDGDLAVGRAFLRACLRGTRSYVSGTIPRFLEEFARTNQLELPALLAMCRRSFVLDGSIDLDDIQRFAAWSAAQGMSPEEYQAETLIDGRFLDA